MQELTFSKEAPAIYEKLKEQFGVDFNKGLIIAEGYTLHCKFDISPEKVVHELVHSKRQTKIGKDLWWSLYLNKESFRLEEEVLAYRAEYKFICNNIPDRNQRFNFLHELSLNLSSKQYGNLCTYRDALLLIQKYDK